jgi:hypothetical protein
MNKQGLSVQDKDKATKRHIARVLRRLKPYNTLSFLERYAVFMGKVQVVELLLKRALVNDREYAFEKVEKTPLGGLIRLLKEEKANSFFIFLLEDLNEFRTNMAHEFLANQMLLDALLGRRAKQYTKPLRELEKALFSVEQFLVNYESAPPKLLWKTQKRHVCFTPQSQHQSTACSARQKRE